MGSVNAKFLVRQSLDTIQTGSKYVMNWVVSDIMPHTCVIPNLLLDRPNLTSALVAQLLYNGIVEKKAMGCPGYNQDQI
jgi:hypothetical protein